MSEIEERGAKKVVSINYQPGQEAVVKVPFWKIWWFYAVIAAFLAILSLAFLSIYRIKLKETKKRFILHEKMTGLKLEALRKQMNPHFIFNSLSSIQRYINENDKKASNKYLSLFAKLMRQILRNSGQKYISVREEMEMLENYISLELMRFSNKFSYEIDIDKEIEQDQYMIPSLLVQPFVENAIWHGLMHKKEDNGLLIVRLFWMQKSILCKVIDNGIGRKRSAEINATKKKVHQSLGIEITKSRFDLINSLYGEDFSIYITDCEDEKGGPCGTVVYINIPLIRKTKHDI